MGVLRDLARALKLTPHRRRRIRALVVTGREKLTRARDALTERVGRHYGLGPQEAKRLVREQGERKDA
jgi:hypothetical protein